MRFFDPVPWYMWFRMHKEFDSEAPISRRYTRLAESLSDIFETNNLEGILFIVGDNGSSEDYLEPVYLVKLTHEIQVLVHFEGTVGFEVNAKRPLSVNWMNLFDTTRSAGTKLSLFPTQSYHENHTRFSGYLKNSNLLYTFLFLLKNAK